MNESVELFVSECQQSSQLAYQKFKQLLYRLESSETRLSAYQFLTELCQYYQSEQPENCHFQFLQQNILDHNDNTCQLDLLQFPSTFLPEAWSFTFYEGLVRYPANEYYNRKLIELGCGIGWISIALAVRYGPEYIYGLDINPKAIVCARLNLYLNAFNHDGSLKTLRNQKSLLDTVLFHESNLFSVFDSDELEGEQNSLALFDRIIGCIPQVLNPEPKVMETLIAENASDEYLHSLSNYFAKQGYIEDQFGLGLIASAVEQSISLLRQDGKLILNLGGRPGRSVLERLMQRRGFTVRRVWQTQVEQAADTEIDALVDIEKNTGHRFEFYMSASSEIPIDACTALEYAIAGGKIYHSVDVYEAKMLFPEQVKSIYDSVDSLGGQELRSAVDLTYENYADAEERYSFLAFLAQKLLKLSHFPYEDTEGLGYFRQQLAEFFAYYLKLSISEREVFITPGRRELVSSLLTSYQPELCLIAKDLAYMIENNRVDSACKILETPSRVEYLLELIEKLQPQLVITQLDIHEVQSSQLVAQLLDCVVKNRVLLVIDLTDNIDLSSQPDINGVYRYLSLRGLPDNLILMAALVNNHVYQKYSLNITLTSNRQIAEHLSDAAELTYSRTPVLKQYYYAHLLEELLFFQRTRTTVSAPEKKPEDSSSPDITLCEQAWKAFSHPAIKGNHLAFNESTIRLDFGENELPMPTLLKQTLFESYLVRKCINDESSAEEVINLLLSSRFNFSQKFYSAMVFGNGVAPIYAALLNLCLQEQKRLLIPSGSYGYFRAAAEYKSLDVCILETCEKNTFKITPEELQAQVSNKQGAWLFLNAPVVNPTGAIYTQTELTELLHVAARNQVTVIMDCIFSGLEFDQTLRWDLSGVVEEFSRYRESQLIIIGGISKEYAAGGLRYGYAWSTSKQLTQSLDKELVHKPHFTLSYAIRKLIEAQLSEEQSLSAHLLAQRQLLAERAERLGSLLESQGWQVIKPSGGLFLVAKPQQYIEANGLSEVEGGDRMAEILFKQKNIVINNSTWTGLPGYCRFVLSCCDADFEQALDRMMLD